MRGSTRLSFMILAAAVWIVIAVSASAQAPDFSKVQIKTTKIGNNFYTLEGQGGTIGALVGLDGVLLVDTQFAPLTEKLVAAIDEISDGRIRLVVNTHLHGDHTGGDENFAKLGAIVMARDELRAGLAKSTPPPPPGALPMVTYRGPVTVHMNGEAVQLIPVPAAHTDGDTMVRFPVVDVLMTGDFFRSVGYPNIDLNNGGSLKGMLDGLNAVINAVGPNTKIIPGHGPVTDRAGVTAHRDMIMAIRDRVAGLVRQGKSVEEVTASVAAADYDTRVAGATAQTRDRFVGQLYAELKGAR